MEVLAVVALLVAVVAVALALLSLRNHQRLRRAARVLTAGGSGDLLALLDRHVQEAAALRRELQQLRDEVDATRGLAAAGLSRIATLRYDAFNDTGGRMSFSTALLNSDGNGVVVTSINGRTEARTYAKPIIAGESRHVLTEEEREVVARALRVAEPEPIATVSP